MNACPAIALLRHLLEDNLSADEQTAVSLHVEACLSCQGRLEQLTQGFSSLRLVRGDPLEASATTGLYEPPSGDLTGVYMAPGRAEPSAATTGTPQIEGYEVLAVLGRGGMGVVYKARQRKLNRLVALKMIRAATADEEEYQVRFRAEAEAVAALGHPNILQIYEVGEAGGLPFFALELLEGGSLEARLKAGPLPARQATVLLSTLARAVHSAHAAGIVHRDLKPANVLFTADGIAKVADFGLAKRLEDSEVRQTQTGQVVGSPHYMAPEQARGQSREVGPAADVYSLGVILYEMLTGSVPFRGTTVLETLRMVGEAEPVPPQRLQPGVPRDLDTICLKCLQKEPGRRYASAQALADDLDRFLSDRPILARRTPWWEKVRKWARRRPAAALTLAFGLAVVLAAAGGGYSAHLSDQSELENRREHAESELTIAQKALSLRDWHAAIRVVSGMLPSVEEEVRLHSLKARAEELKQLAEQELAREGREASDRASYERFFALLDDVLFYDAGFTGMDKEANRAALRDRAAKALKLLADWKPASLTKAEVERLREGRYELLLALAAEGHDALRLLEEASGLLPPNRAYHLRRAACLAGLGDRDGAARASAEADRLEPSSAFDHFLTGLELYRASDAASMAKAVGHFHAALARQPDHFWAQCLLALCRLRASPPRLNEAAASLTGCLSRRPDFVWARLLRGYAQAEAGRSASDPTLLAAADEDYARAARLLAVRPDREADYVLRVHRGLLRGYQKRPADAARELESAISLKPDEFTAYANLSGVHAGQGRLEEATAQLDHAIRLKPRLAQLYRARALLGLRRKDFPAALRDFEASARWEDPRSTLLAHDHADRGRLLLRARRATEGLAAADKALLLQPDLSRAQALRVLSLLELERYDDLLPACDAYLEREAAAGSREDRADLHRVRALARVRKSDYPGALADYHQALRLVPASPELHAGRGWVYLLSDAPRLALPDFEEAVRLRPASADAHNGRGLARVLLRRPNDGAADAAAAVRLDPDNDRTLYNAARVFAQAAQLAGPGPGRDYEEKAWELLQRALDRKPQAQRGAFWREKVETDAALAVLRHRKGFAALAARYAGTGR